MKRTEYFSKMMCQSFKYLKIAVINQNYIHNGIKSRLKVINACCHLAQSRFSSIWYLKI